MPTVVLIPDRVEDADIERGVFGEDTEVLTPNVHHADDIDTADWARADAVLAWHDLDYNAEVLGRMERCKVIVRIGAGFDNVDLEAAGHRGIAVCNVPDYGTTDVADHAMALLLSLARGVAAFDARARLASDGWEWIHLPTLRRLAGATLGIIGLGRIGTTVALRAKAFGMRVVFYDPYVPEGLDKALGVTRLRDLRQLAAESDAVTFHTPLTPETRGLADAAFFEAIQPGALLVNVARGPVVDLDALTAALRSGRVAGAGLDVLPQEPPDPEHPLIRAWLDRDDWIADRLLITPHLAFLCDAAVHEMREKGAQEAGRALRGEPLRNCVNAAFLASAA